MYQWRAPELSAFGDMLARSKPKSVTFVVSLDGG
jgi:hypothetical protein